MVELDPTLLRSWPGRFRHPGVLEALGDGEPEPCVLVEALLDGLVADLDVAQAVAQLIEAGAYGVAAEAIGQCDDLDAATERRLQRALTVARQADVDDLDRHLLRLSTLAEDVDLQVGLDREQLVKDLQTRRHPVFAAIDQRESELDRAWAERADALRARVAEHTAAATWWTNPILAALEAGDLGAAERLCTGVDDSDVEIEGPAAVPRPPDWTWGAYDPHTVLGWLQPEATGVPPELRRDWPTDPAGSRLAATFLGLANLDETTADEFRQALGAFLDVSARPLRPLEGGGYYTELELPGFGPRLTVHLWIPTPGEAEPPAELDDFFLARVGADPRQADGSLRSRIAVLDAREIARLAAVGSRRWIGLLRILGPQWPLAAIAGEPEDLEAALGPRERWLVNLAWFLDLSAVASYDALGAIVHEMGRRPRLIAELLHSWAMLGVPSRRQARADVYTWVDDRPLCRKLSMAMRDLAPSPAARAVLLGCMGGDLLGVPLSADILSDVQPDELLNGARELAAAGLARADPDHGGDVFVIDGDRVFRALADMARSELPEALDDLRTTREIADRRRREASDEVRTVHYAHRFARLDRERLAAEQSGDHALAEQLAQAIKDEEARLYSDEPTDEVTEVVRAIKNLHTLAQKIVSRSITINVVTEEAPRATISSWKVYAVVGILLENAIDSVIERGRAKEIRVSINTRGGKIHVDVQDSGTGVRRRNGELLPAANKWEVWETDFTSRGDGRGMGLWLAKAILDTEVAEVDLIEAKGPFPLDGAHFRLVLPLAPEQE